MKIMILFTMKYFYCYIGILTLRYIDITLSELSEICCNTITK